MIVLFLHFLISLGAEIPMPYAANLEAQCLPQLSDIEAAVRKLAKR